MFRSVLRFLALVFLCVLLIYAPEIYARVSPPYHITVDERILLRIALCTQDADSAKAVLSALTLYMKEHPSIHARIIRTDAQQLFALPSPSPDLLIFSSTIRHDPSDFLSSSAHASLTPLFPPNGEPLHCGAAVTASNPDAALDLLVHLADVFAPAG